MISVSKSLLKYFLSLIIVSDVILLIGSALTPENGISAFDIILAIILLLAVIQYQWICKTDGGNQ